MHKMSIPSTVGVENTLRDGQMEFEEGRDCGSRGCGDGGKVETEAQGVEGGVTAV